MIYDTFHKLQVYASLCPEKIESLTPKELERIWDFLQKEADHNQYTSCTRIFCNTKDT